MRGKRKEINMKKPISLLLTILLLVSLGTNACAVETEELGRDNDACEDADDQIVNGAY